MRESAQEKKYTISQTAKLVGVSKRTIQRWIATGKLPTIIDSFGLHLISENVLMGIPQAKSSLRTSRAHASVSGIFTISEAARTLGISKRTLLRWEKAGLITSRRTVGGARRFSKKDVILLTGSRTMYQHVPKQGELLLLPEEKLLEGPKLLKGINLLPKPNLLKGINLLPKPAPVVPIIPIVPIPPMPVPIPAPIPIVPPIAAPIPSPGPETIIIPSQKLPPLMTNNRWWTMPATLGLLLFLDNGDNRCTVFLLFGRQLCFLIFSGSLLNIL